LRSHEAVAVKNTAALARETSDASALYWAALAGELVAAFLLFASGSVPPILVRSLQLFLRF
jgi:hypothetical protein